MLFNSPAFLFLFFPLVLLFNRFLNNRLSNIFLLAVSLIFYTYGEGKWVLLLMGSILWNYAFGLLLHKEFEQKNSRRAILWVNIVGNLALLIYFKYAYFFSTTLFTSPELSLHFKDLILPLGISFFTFQGISYTVDVFRKTVPAESSLIKIGLYISYFPQLIAGPIIKYKEINKYLSHRKIESNDVYEGLQRFIRGLAKKVVFADNFSIISDEIFNANSADLSTPIAWLGVLSYTLQIYFDFSAYSDMAIALGRMMGFKIPENFNYPYVATSIRNFWKRWHISLSTWFKEYLYIPLGGNQKSTTRTFLNLILVFFITGLWHGASINFILWGLVHGLFMIIERVLSKYNYRLLKGLGIFYTLLVVSLSWVLFRTADLSSAADYYALLFSFKAESNSFVLIKLTPYFVFLFILGVLFTTPLRVRINQYLNSTSFADGLAYKLVSIFMSLCLLIYSITEVISSNHHPFIYFKF